MYIVLSVDKSKELIGVGNTTTNDDCILDRAVEAARLSRFNVDGSAPDRQQGTITYLFVPQ